MLYMLQCLCTYVVCVCSKCFIYFRCMLQMFYLYVAYVSHTSYGGYTQMLQVYVQNVSADLDVRYNKCFMFEAHTLGCNGRHRWHASTHTGRMDSCMRAQYIASTGGPHMLFRAGAGSPRVRVHWKRSRRDGSRARGGTSSTDSYLLQTREQGDSVSRLIMTLQCRYRDKQRSNRV
jgi:hypothetical protein